MRRIIAYLIPLILSAAPKTVSTIAGTGVAGFSGDGGPAIAGQTNNPYGLVIGPDGALYFCEVGNHRVRRLGSPRDSALNLGRLDPVGQHRKWLGRIVTRLRCAVISPSVTSGATRPSSASSRCAATSETNSGSIQ